MAKPYRNLRTMVKNERGTAIVSQFDCGFDALSRKSSVVNSGGAFTADAFNLYGYNDRNELGQSSRYLGNNIAVTATPVPSEHRAYAYDPIGNRTQVSAGSLAWSYTSNELNQYTQESVPGDGTDALTYDDDGNLTAIDFGSAPDVTYTYDAENRLIAVAPPTPVANDKKTEYLYDYMGRRVRKKVLTYTDGAWALDTQKLYVYDGWNLIAEIDGSNTTYHVWGLDLSGTLQGAGGVGGLLGTITGTAGYFALYDTNGNITDYVDAQGTVVAHYEYDPYGGILTAAGTKQDDFALRFSTKYLDDTGLYYYGYRYYSPALGRWLSRDRIGERGGEHLYAFVFNDPIGLFDLLGLTSDAMGGSCFCGPDVTKWFYGEAKAHVSFAKSYQDRAWLIRMERFFDQAKYDMAYKWMDFSVLGCGTGRCKNTVGLAGTCVRKNQLGNIMFTIVGAMFPPGYPANTAEVVQYAGYEQGPAYSKNHPHAKKLYGKYVGAKRKDNWAAFEIGMVLGKDNRWSGDYSIFINLLKNEISNRSNDLTYIPLDGGFYTSSCSPCMPNGVKVEWTGCSSFEARKALFTEFYDQFVIPFPFNPSLIDEWLKREYEDYSK